jgi:hypothetical protein
VVIDLSDISGLPIQLQETTCDGQKVWKLTGDIVPKPGKCTLDDIRPMLLDDSISEPIILKMERLTRRNDQWRALKKRLSSGNQ